MKRQSHEFLRFLDRLHARHVALRVIERMGIGLLAGCAAAAPLLLLMLWRGRSAESAAVILLAMGLAGGMLWGILTRPTRLAAAVEGDRQLDWADLLSSALKISEERTADPWAAAVMATADLKCRSTSPSTVMLNRLGARSWGGIGLAAALVLVLGLLPIYAASGRADDTSDSSTHVSLLPADASERQAPLGSSAARRGPRQAEPQDSNSSRMNLQDADNQRQPPGSDAHGGNHAAGATDANVGNGSGQSQSKFNDRGTPSADHQATRSHSEHASGPAADGAGVSTPRDNAGTDASAATVAGSTSSRGAVAPWKSADWPADVRRAGHAMDSGRVPDAYRDVVRRYFDEAQFPRSQP